MWVSLSKFGTASENTRVTPLVFTSPLLSNSRELLVTVKELTVGVVVYIS